MTASLSEHVHRPRFVHADLRPFGPDGTLLTTPRGATYRIDSPPQVVHRLLTRLDGRTDVGEVLAAPEAGEQFAEVIDVLLEEGCLTSAPDDGRARDRVRARFPSGAGPAELPPATAVVIVGDLDLADRFTELLDLPIRRLATPDVAPEALLADLQGAGGDESIPIEPGTVVVAVRHRFDGPWLAALDDALTALGVRWSQFHLDGGRGYWGPSVVPGRTATYADLIARRRCAVDEEGMFDALTAPPVADEQLLPDGEIAWMLGAFAADVERWLDGLPCRSLSTEVEADPVTLTLHDHPVLPLPDRHLTGDLLISGPRDHRLLIDERTGIIQRTRRITHHRDVPARLVTVQTHNSSMGRIDLEWANDVITGGSTFDDADAALHSAIGEAVERYCGNYMGQNELRWAAYDDLVAAGEHAVDPGRLVLYSERTYDTPGCPFVRFTRDLPVRWVRGRSLTHDRPVWLPVTLVYVNWLAGELGGEPGGDHVRHPITNYMNFSGVAAGRTLEQALVSGIEELVERDATMIWWLNGHPLPGVTSTPALQALWDGAPAAAGQHGTLVHLDNEFGIPVMAGIVHHQADGWFTIGFAARPDPEQAALKAWTEALTLQEGSRDLAVEDSLIRQAVDWGMASYAGLKPWRADRRYLDDYRDDFRDVSDLMCQQQIFLDPRAVDAVRPWTDVPATRPMTDLPRLPDRSLSTYAERVERRGFEICYVDLTTQDVAAGGMHAVRVIIPGLVPNFPAAFPMLGTGRVQRAPVALGWRTTPLTEQDLNYWPIPHA